MHEEGGERKHLRRKDIWKGKERLMIPVLLNRINLCMSHLKNCRQIRPKSSYAMPQDAPPKV